MGIDSYPHNVLSDIRVHTDEFWHKRRYQGETVIFISQDKERLKNGDLFWSVYCRGVHEGEDIVMAFVQIEREQDQFWIVLDKSKEVIEVNEDQF